MDTGPEAVEFVGLRQWSDYSQNPISGPQLQDCIQKAGTLDL